MVFHRLLPTLLILVFISACSTNPLAPPSPQAAPTLALPTASPTETTAAQSESDNFPPCLSDNLLCVGLAVDIGLLNDKSFNQSAWEGAKRAEADLGARVEFFELETGNEQQEAIEYFVDNFFDVIVTVGFNWSESTVEAARDNPEVYFIGVDQFQSEPIDNLAGLVFPELHAGFLAGSLAAMLSNSGKVATVLGTDMVPPVVAFKEGYIAGASAINPDIEVIATYHPGEMLVAFNDPEWGAEQARQMLDDGADVIFAAGGNTGNGSLIEVAASGGAYCIGVDADQWQSLPEARPCLVSSALKKISNGVFELIARKKIGEPPSGNFEGDVGLAPFYDFESIISAEAKAVLIELNDGLASGSIPTDGSYVYPDPPSLAAPP